MLYGPFSLLETFNMAFLNLSIIIPLIRSLDVCASTSFVSIDADSSLI